MDIESVIAEVAAWLEEEPLTEEDGWFTVRQFRDIAKPEWASDRCYRHLNALVDSGKLETGMYGHSRYYRKTSA
jgi:hypothetical protein